MKIPKDQKFSDRTNDYKENKRSDLINTCSILGTQYEE